MLHRGNTKQHICDETVKLCSETRDIAKAFGVNEAPIYHHYENKADILDAILDNFRNRMKRFILTRRQADRFIETG